jgi:hypothetical protein
VGYNVGMSDPPPPEVNRPDVVAEVRRAFLDYEDALVANRVDELVDAFWDSPLTVRYGIDEIHHGHEAIAAFRRSQARATMPRHLRNTVVTTFGDALATVDTEFVPEGSQVVGRQSQTWLRTEAGWRVTSAHVSWLAGLGPD